MSVQLAQQAKAILGKSAVGMRTERVDDVALRSGQRVTMGWPEVWDRPIPRHGTPRRSRWGWTAVSGLASLVTEGDRRTVAVATSRKGRPHTLSPLTAQVSAPLAVRDERWSPLLQPVRPPASGHQSARDGPARRLEGSDVSQAVSRCEATTVSGAPEVPAGGL
jgi:hypothetical protein